MQDWKRFESLVAAIHRALNAKDYDVETDIVLNEPSGATHQIDVLLRPKTSFAGPILVSCKAWANPVGVDHVREWADIVQHTGAASGVIVAKTGFTKDALSAAGNPERRLTLWRPRLLTLDDFAPDAGSRNGYIARVQTRCIVTEPRFVEGSFQLDTFRADGKPTERDVSYTFSADVRNHWYLRDVDDSVAENLWDLFVERATTAPRSEVVEILPPAPRFLVFDGVRLGFRRATFEIDLRKHEFSIEMDLRKRAIAYENMLTGKVSVVPLPQVSQLDLLGSETSPDAGV